MLSKGRASVSATPVYEYRADVEKFFNSRSNGALCELQCAFGIDYTVEIKGVFLIRMMHSSSKVDDRLDFGESGSPIRCRTDRFNRHLGARLGKTPDCTAHGPAFTRKSWRKMSANEAGCSGNKYCRFALFHRDPNSSGARNNSFKAA